MKRICLRIRQGRIEVAAQGPAGLRIGEPTRAEKAMVRLRQVEAARRRVRQPEAVESPQARQAVKVALVEAELQRKVLRSQKRSLYGRVMQWQRQVSPMNLKR